MASEGLISRERKDVVEMGGEVDGVLNISCNHCEASLSGHAEFKKISNSGIHDSILHGLSVYQLIPTGSIETRLK